MLFEDIDTGRVRTGVALSQSGRNFAGGATDVEHL